MKQLALIAHNLRSSHNIGSLLRTAEGLGVERVLLTGYSPYPKHDQDERLPHMAEKLDRQIHKTALGAEKTIQWQHIADVNIAIKQLRAEGFEIAGLEQSANSVALNKFKPTSKIALIVGREVEGIEADVLNMCDVILEIPMYGHKESFNVAQAAAMALYHLRFSSDSKLNQ